MKTLLIALLATAAAPPDRSSEQTLGAFVGTWIGASPTPRRPRDKPLQYAETAVNIDMYTV